MKDKITKLRNELKQLKKSNKIYKRNKQIKPVILPHIKKEKNLYFEEEVNNDILHKL
jgi:aspartate-semialdehyde dehydrogenase